MYLPPLHELTLRQPRPTGVVLPLDLEDLKDLPEVPDCPICLRSLEEPAPDADSLYSVDPVWTRMCPLRHGAHVWCAYQWASRAQPGRNQPCPVCRTPMLEGQKQQPPLASPPKSGFHRFKFRTGTVYEGEWEGGDRNGQGKQTWLDRRVYEGTWKDGQPSGQGKFTFRNGKVYEGEWKDGKFHGQGKLIYPSELGGLVREGEWKNGKMDGQGKETYSGGGVYDGAWKDDKRHGQGKQTYSDGGVYEGDWKDGERHGQGTFTWPGGAGYVGEWKDGAKDGQGKQTLANGDYLEGTWSRGRLRNGRARLTDTNGLRSYSTVNEGEWKEEYTLGPQGRAFRPGAGDIAPLPPALPDLPAPSLTLQVKKNYMRNMVWKKHPKPAAASDIGQGVTLYDPYQSRSVLLDQRKQTWELIAPMWLDWARSTTLLGPDPALEQAGLQLCLDTVVRMTTTLVALESPVGSYESKLGYALRFLDSIFNPELNTEIVARVAAVRPSVTIQTWGMVMRVGWYYYRAVGAAGDESTPSAQRTASAQREALSRWRIPESPVEDEDRPTASLRPLRSPDPDTEEPRVPPPVMREQAPEEPEIRILPLPVPLPAGPVEPQGEPGSDEANADGIWRELERFLVMADAPEQEILRVLRVGPFDHFRTSDRLPGMTLLMMAAMHGYLRVMQMMLLSFNAYVPGQPPGAGSWRHDVTWRPTRTRLINTAVAPAEGETMWKTASWYALAHGKFDSAMVLFDLGAEVQNDDPEQPWDLIAQAREFGYPESPAEQRALYYLRLWVQVEANNLEPNDAMSLLERGAAVASFVLMRNAIDQGASVVGLPPVLSRRTSSGDIEQIANKEEKNVLMTAILFGHELVVGFLLEEAIRNPQDDVSELFKLDAMGNSPMHVAAAFGNLRIVERLLPYTDSLSLRNTFGLTPYQLARRWRHDQVAERINPQPLVPFTGFEDYMLGRQGNFRSE